MNITRLLIPLIDRYSKVGGTYDMCKRWETHFKQIWKSSNFVDLEKRFILKNLMPRFAKIWNDGTKGSINLNRSDEFLMDSLFT